MNVGGDHPPQGSSEPETTGSHDAFPAAVIAQQREETASGVTLHRCGTPWKFGPCWRVQKALDHRAIPHDIVRGPWRPKHRAAVLEGTGQHLFPAIQFADGGWYREDSKDMARTIREGRLLDPPTRATTSERTE